MQETQGNLWLGKIPRAVEQLSPRATTIEPVLESSCATAAATSEPVRLEPELHSKRSHRNEKLEPIKSVTMPALKKSYGAEVIWRQCMIKVVLVNLFGSVKTGNPHTCTGHDVALRLIIR